MIRALIPAPDMNQLRPARCGLSHEPRGRLSLPWATPTPQADTCHPRESGDQAVGTQGSGDVSREIVESEEGGKPYSVVVFWMLAFASMTKCITSSRIPCRTPPFRQDASSPMR